jgi:hypothetical protein
MDHRVIVQLQSINSKNLKYMMGKTFKVEYYLISSRVLFTLSLSP